MDLEDTPPFVDRHPFSSDLGEGYHPSALHSEGPHETLTCVPPLLFAFPPLVEASPCRDQSGQYKMFEDCQVSEDQLPRNHPVRVTQQDCATVTLDATLSIPVPVPGEGGPYDMCAIAEFNCGLYGDGCEYAHSDECRNRPPAPAPEVRAVSFTVPYAEVRRDFSGRVMTLGQCRVYR